jgi:hypothetical protein
MGDGLSPRGGSLHPPRQSRGGGRGDSAWGRRGSTHRQAAYERGDAGGGTTGGAPP